MANIKSAKKRVKVIRTKTLRNKMIRSAVKTEVKKVYAAVAPAIAGQFIYAKRGQVISGIKALGFDEVVEVALGADMTTWHESQELREKGMLSSSCCPAFVSYVEKNFPDMLPYVSSTLSPMAMIGKHIKEQDPTAKVVFIGPCTAKKMEIRHFVHRLKNRSGMI